MLVDRLLDDSPLALVGGPGAGVLLALGVRQLPFELAVTGQSILAEAAVVERGPDRAAGLGTVAAVAEPATGRELDDVVERRLDTLVRPGDLERSDARRVDEERAAGQREQLPMGGRVAAARIVLADGSRRLACLAEEGVHQRRLPDARRSEHDGGRPGPQVRREIGQMVPGQRRERDDRDAGRDRLDRHASAVGVEPDVGLVEDRHGHDPARPRDREVALHAPQVEVAIEARDEERDVDVRGDDLLVDQVAGRSAVGVGRAPDERGPARDDRRDDRRVVGRCGRRVVEHHPVADGRVVAGPERLEPEPAGHDGRPLTTGLVADDRGLLVDGQDPGRAASTTREGQERCVPGGVPAEGGRRRCAIVGGLDMAQPTRFSLPVRLA